MTLLREGVTATLAPEAGICVGTLSLLCKVGLNYMHSSHIPNYILEWKPGADPGVSYDNSLSWPGQTRPLLLWVLGQLPTGDHSSPEKNKAQLLPTRITIPRTTHHQDHYQPVKPLIRTNTVYLYGGELSWWGLGGGGWKSVWIQLLWWLIPWSEPGCHSGIILEFNWCNWHNWAKLWTALYGEGFEITRQLWF